MERETVYLGRANSIDVLLKLDGVVYDMSGVTHIHVVFSGVTFSSVERTTWFDWTTGTTGQLSLKLGGVTGVAAGLHQMELILYDVTNTSGIHWGEIPVVVKS